MGKTKLQTSGSCSCNLAAQLASLQAVKFGVAARAAGVEAHLGNWQVAFLLFGSLRSLALCQSQCVNCRSVCAEPASGLRQQQKRQSVPLLVYLPLCLSVCLSFSQLDSQHTNLLIMFEFGFVAFLSLFHTCFQWRRFNSIPTPSQALHFTAKLVMTRGTLSCHLARRCQVASCRVVSYRKIFSNPKNVSNLENN